MQAKTYVPSKVYHLLCMPFFVRNIQWIHFWWPHISYCVRCCV